MKYNVKGKIHLNEKVANQDRRFGSALTYIPAIVIDTEGNETPVLFTEAQIKMAQERAERNPEDIPEDQTFFSKLFG